MIALMICTYFLNIKFILSEGIERLGYSKSLVFVSKGSLTQGVGESPVRFFSVHAKKWGENRVPDVHIKELVIPCMCLRERQKSTCFGEI
jgi:hypothetical protein